ncbi:MAG: PAAR domain-containing protein [Selenomonadaceae bacterium]|nr:PAAR domain-containing protein [Selenomonadaceae bacterium]
MRATRLGDLNTGHDECPPRRLIEASSDVFFNGRGAGRVGDTYAEHACEEHLPHNDVIAAGSQSVYINGRAAGRIGDAVAIGGSVMEGSPDIWIGD